MIGMLYYSFCKRIGATREYYYILLPTIPTAIFRALQEETPLT